MFSLEECRRIKRECTKKYKGKNVVVNVSQYPFTYVVVTHGDGKSWGYFFNYNKESTNRYQCYKIGRSDSEILTVIFRYGSAWLNRSYNNIIISNDSELEKVYNEFLHYIEDNGYCYTYCHNYNPLSLMYLNPQLFRNFIDAEIYDRNYYKSLDLNVRLKNDYNTYNSHCKFSGLNKLISDCINEEDLSKPLLKDAFKIPVKWLRAKFISEISFKRILYLKQLGYDPAYVSMLSSYLINSFDEKWFRNKNVIDKLLSDESCYYYRDYLRILDALPEDLKKDFPICPENVRKYHDKVVRVYNNHRNMIETLKIKARNDKYLKDVYPSAAKFEFEDNDYTIIACKQLEDLSKEGLALHHCVGTYINSVSEGKEYILFLREKSDIDKSYFTIDLTTDKKVRQIHGLCNCNMSKDIKPFVDKWAKKFDLDLSGCSGVKCALH